jgi:transposase InsO family protein
VKPHESLIPLVEGTRLIVDGKFGVIEEVHPAHARVRFHDGFLNVDRRDETTELALVEWPDLFGPAASGMLMDQMTRKVWDGWRPHRRTRTAARLAVVNLLAYGCRSGHEGVFNDVGEPIPELRSGGRHLVDLKGEIHSRAIFLEKWLKAADHDWIPQLLADWWSNDKPDAPLKQKVPGSRSLERAIEQVRDGGLFALADGRGGDQNGKNGVGARRAATETLTTVVLSARTEASSKKTDEWYVRQVEQLAEEKGIPILGKSSLREHIRLRLNKAGRTPSQKKTADMAEDRDEYQSSRAWAPGLEIAYDQTAGDNLVRMTEGGKAVRPNVHAAVETCSGAIVNVDATGLYRDSNLAMVLYDAARPFVVLPDEHGRKIPRIKGMTRSVILGEGVLKPGAIGATYRSDNISQNHSIFMAGIMKMLRADIAPSRAGRSTDNAPAESAIKGLAQFFEDADAYVGTHTGNRARGAGATDSLDIDEYRALIQQFAFFEYNHAPCPAPMFKGSGLSRLQVWDMLIAEHGAPPALVDPNAWFAFLKPHTRQISSKGIRHKDQQFHSRLLKNLPRHVLGPDGGIEYLVDGRQLDCIWVPDPKERVFYEIPNVLRDLTDAPLTRETAKLARSMSGVKPPDGFHAAKAYSHVLEQIRLSDDKPVQLQRSLADVRAAWFGYGETLANGANVVTESALTGYPGSEPPPAETPRTPFGHPGPQAPTPEDVLDRPIVLEDS